MDALAPAEPIAQSRIAKREMQIHRQAEKAGRSAQMSNSISSMQTECGWSSSAAAKYALAFLWISLA